MKRREVVVGLAAAVAWPLAARAQQPERMRRIAVLMAYAESKTLEISAASAGLLPDRDVSRRDACELVM